MGSSSNMLWLVVGVFAVGCTPTAGIYKGLENEQDGVIAVAISADEAGIAISQEAAAEAEQLHYGVDQLTEQEKQFIDELHEGEYSKVSFMVVDGESGVVVKSYLAETFRRLASVTKIATSLAALENVNNISTYKVAKMLKNSNNGEASRYLHLAAKAIDGTTISTPPYTDQASCPDAVLAEHPLTAVTFSWLKAQLPEDDWTTAALYDGAGCHYDNFMNSRQTLRIIQLADSFGEAYEGQSFADLLSISGQDGTWKNYNRDHQGYIFAKTGTLLPNSNLAGFFFAKRNKRMHKYFFNVFVEKKGGGTYTTSSRRLIESLLRYWINYYATSDGVDLGLLAEGSSSNGESR